MIGHLTQKQFDDYSRRQLRAADLLSVSEHLGNCEACRRQIESASNGDLAFFALRSQVFAEVEDISAPERGLAHLTTDQTIAFVDENLAGEGLQVVADHLATCELCVLAVDDLRAFKNEIGPSLEREYHPVSVASPAEGWWQRTFAFLPAFFRVSPGPAFGAALAVLLLLVIGWLIWRTPRETGPKQEIVVSPPSPLPTPNGVSPAPAPPESQPANAIAQLNDGNSLLTLDREGKLSGADNLPSSYQSLLTKALTTQRIERSSQLKGITRPPSSLMSSDKENQEFSVIEPVGDVLLTARPVFRWTPMEGATGYVVEVYDSNFKLVVASPQLVSNSWAAPLSRGKIYAWQVKAIKDGQEVTSPRPPAPQAKFRILDQAKASELAKARTAYGSSHLVLGLLYAEAGLLKEAERELRLLQRANPKSEITRNLLRQIQALQRQSE